MIVMTALSSVGIQSDKDKIDHVSSTDMIYSQGHSFY